MDAAHTVVVSQLMNEFFGKEAGLRLKAVSSLSKQPVAGAAVQIRIL